MTSATGSLIRSLPIPKCCITAVPTLLKPTKFSSFSASFPSRVSLKHKISSSSGVVSSVAQISEWAQEEGKVEQESGDGLKWEGEEEEGDGIGDVEEGDDSIAEPNEDAKLFVGGLPFDIDSEDLAELFDQAGVVASAEVIYNKETDKSRGFGYVTMSTVEEAQKAAKMFNRYELDGWLLNVNKVPSASDRSFRIYVGNLALEMDDSRLEQVFSEHGKVMHARVFFHRQTGRSRGFGFVTMSSETEMNDAIAALDGQTLDGKSIRVKVAVDQPRRGSF